jgi:hypothetical protein
MQHPTRIIAIVLMIFAFSSGAQAASSCKDLSTSACSSKQSCSWIRSYKTKKGVKVDGYCRSKPGKKAKKAGKTIKDKKSIKKKAASKNER